MRTYTTLALSALLSTAIALPTIEANSPEKSVSEQDRAQLNHVYAEAYANELAGKTSFGHAGAHMLLTAKVKPAKKCEDQCGRTAAACSAACLSNLLSLNVGNLAPCMASCGTASAACQGECTQAEKNAGRADAATKKRDVIDSAPKVKSTEDDANTRVAEQDKPKKERKPKPPKADKPAKEKVDHSEKKQCNAQCGRTGAACSAACLQNVLALNIGNVAPCFASCGAASAACHNACTQAEKDELEAKKTEAEAAAAATTSAPA